MTRLIIGVQPVREAVRIHGAGLERVLIDARGSKRLDALARHAADQGVAVERVSRDQLDRVASGGRHQGVVGFGPELEIATLAQLQAERDAPLIVLDGITDPQNFGAVLRSAVALGSGAVLWAEYGAAPLTPATFRASAGAVEHARLFRVSSLRSALTELDALGLATVALDPSAPATLAELSLGRRCAVVVGSEELGVSRGVRRACGHRARLTMTGRVQSLNASVAAAVALYELTRQQQAEPVEEPD